MARIAGMDALSTCRIQGTAKTVLLSTEALDLSWNTASAVKRQENSTSTGQRASAVRMQI